MILIFCVIRRSWKKLDGGVEGGGKSEIRGGANKKNNQKQMRKYLLYIHWSN